MLPHQGQQVILDAPASDIIKDLIGGTVSAVRLGEQLLHIVRIQIGHAPRPDQTILFQLLHALHRLRQRHGTAPVEQIEIQMIRLHPHQ